MRVIVIGATGTIGTEVAKALRARAHEVIPASRHGNLRVDIEDAATIEALFDSTPDVDAVACCAGEAAFKPFAELADPDYALGLRSKLMGQVTLTRIAAKRLRDGGAIVLTAGVLARHPMIGSAAISLVNAGLEGFTRAAALELPRGIRINVVSPPWVTETLAHLGMTASVHLPAVEVAKAYVEAIEGKRQGQVIEPGKSA